MVKKRERKKNAKEEEIENAINDDDSRQSFLQEINYAKQDEVIFTSGWHNNIKTGIY